jgi:hypothetical protein
MPSKARSLIEASLAALPLALGACAHAPASSLATGFPDPVKGPLTLPQDGRQPQEGRQPERVMVTGSHIPQRVDTTTGLPATIGAMRIYSRSDMLRVGVDPNLAATMLKLDSSFSVP